ncbi:MAG: hypothetical protein WCI71_01900 [Bacteroidota bacterium]
MIKPFAGVTMASIWAWLIRGGSSPFAVDFTSSIAELSGLLLSVFMPTWAKICMLLIVRTATQKQKSSCFFIIM